MDTHENSDTQSDTFRWLEADVAREFGITADTLADLRKKCPPLREQTLTLKRRIFYSKIGVVLAAKAFGLAPTDLLWLENGLPRAEIPYVLRVTPQKTLNPHIILATDGVRSVRVRVKTKENFRPYMIVRATLVGGDLFDLIGNCPRSPGKY